jgi:hypothetical protein
MRRLIREFEHLKGLLSELPPFLKRRVTIADLKWIDEELTNFIITTPPTDKFDDFCDYVLGDLLHNFLVDRKDEEIDTVEDPVYGLVYDDLSLQEIGDIYWELIPYLKKRYEIRLHQAWERKKQR